MEVVEVVGGATNRGDGALAWSGETWTGLMTSHRTGTSVVLDEPLGAVVVTACDSGYCVGDDVGIGQSWNWLRTCNIELT